MKFFLLNLLALSAAFGSAEDIPAPSDGTPLYFFRAHGCPHCAQAEPVLQAIAAQSGLRLMNLEVTTNRDNARLYVAMAQRFGFKARSVPGIFLGKRYWVGYTPETGDAVRAYAKFCALKGCPDASAYRKLRAKPAAKKSEPAAEKSTPLQIESATVQVPFLGKVQLVEKSLWANTALIAFVDGFNPCSLWVLTMLLALTIHTGSRGKTFLIGFTFLTVTSAVYVAFIAGLFSMVQLIGFVDQIRLLMAVITVIMGIINIKDFFWFGKGPSLTISAEKKPGILARMRTVVLSANALWPMLIATVVLSAGVSLTEFSCTAGFPVLWVNIVSGQQVSTASFVALLALYMLIYQLDEIAIFLTVVFTMRIGRLQEKQGRALKLFAGVLMVALAGVLVLRPDLLNNITSSLWIFGGAFTVSAVVLLAARWLEQR